ncbi:MAG: bifunctional oligoribonuclease/PAP phosphatase NrnA [Candidatus Aceula meridiana]|nr:bifunctional oligoribonuclease/PAP phosphatase NrnA [Candidatus Aceula meridiana]
MKNFKRIKKLIRESRDIVITCHINPDGDTIGSMLALGLAFESMGKKVAMVCSDKIPEVYRSLPGIGKIKKNITKKRYDLAIAVDCSSPDILGADLKEFQKVKNVLEIDHHEIRKSFGTISLIDEKAAANGEIVYLLLDSLKVDFSKEIAQNLLTSIIVETNSFRLPQVRELTFKICADLMRTGVNFEKLTNTVYWAQRKESVLLTGICLSRCQFLNNGEIAWALIKQNDFKRIKGLDEDVDAVPDIMRSIEGVKISILFREQDDKVLRVSLRSKGRINVAEIAKEYGGGGHHDVAGCFILNKKKVIGDLVKKASALINR